jgi:hypothetical protein
MRGYKKYFVRSIAKNYPGSFRDVTSATEKNYQVISTDINFSFHSKNPLDRRLDFCAYFLALIKTLDERGEPYESIKRVILEVVTGYVTPKNKVQQLLKRVPPKLIGTGLWNALIKILTKKLAVNENKEGFIARIITSKEETYGLGYGVDIIECGVCKLFNKHNFGKYTPILCEVDKLTAALAGLELIRSGTIANGATKCDFRYRKVK